MANDRHRCPPHLRGAARARFIALQDAWDARLRAAGFKDIEQGRDTLRLSTSTFSGGGEGTSGAHCSLDAVGGVDNRQFRLEDHGTAEYWRIAGQAVHSPPHCHSLYLLDVCATGMVLGPVARRHGLTKKQARRIWRQFTVAVGLAAGNCAELAEMTHGDDEDNVPIIGVAA